jgi:hypothetical protein
MSAAPRKKLVICSRPAEAPPGGVSVVWDETRPAESEGLAPAERERVEAAAIGWAREWGRRALVDGRSFHALGEYNGVSLWWFAEILLHESTDAPRHVRLIERLGGVLDRHRPDEVEARDLPADVTLILFRLCRVRAIYFASELRRRRLERRAAVWACLVRSYLDTAKGMVRAAGAWVRHPFRRRAAGGTTVIMISHA